MKKIYLFKFVLYLCFALSISNSYSQTAKEVIKGMGPGFNLGNVFDNGSKSNEFTDLKPIIDKYVSAGMTHIRIPTTWYDKVDGTRLTDTNGNIIKTHARFIELEKTIDYALSKNLYVVLNTHHEHWLKDNYDGSSYYNTIFTTLWTSIATHFKDYPSKLVFEVLNEPEGTMGKWNTPVLPTAESGILLTRQIAKVGYDAIRAAGGNNTTRIVMISPNGQANDSQIEEVFPNTTYLPGLGNDQYLAIQVHSYDPWPFCGQTGSNTNYPGATQIKNDITACNTHVQNNLGGIALHYGEFGVGREVNQAERAAAVVTEYYQTFAKKCHDLDIPFTVWDDKGWFGLIDLTGTTFTYDIVPKMLSVITLSPQVAFTNITEDQVFAQGFDLTPAVTATHSAGITGVKLYIDNVLLREETVAPYDWGWSTPSDDALATLSVGNHVLKALATSTQGTTAEVIVNITIQSNNVAPTVNITAPANGTAVISGTTITITANAADTAPGTVSSVAFYDGATLLATDTTAPYSYAWAGATTGTHTITAKATDNNGAVTTSAAITVTVNAAAPVVAFTNITEDQVFAQGFDLTPAVNATHSSGITGVKLYLDNVFIREETVAPYDWGWSTPSDDALATLSVGNHVLKALATSTQGTTAEAIVNITIQSNNVAPTVNITAPTTGTSVTSGTAITITANAADTAPGTVSSVAFYDGATLLATDTTSPYSFSWTNASIATHTITAVATDNNGAATTSAAVTVTVNAAPPVVAFTNITEGQVFAQGFDLTPAVNATHSAGITGVKLYLDNVLVREETVAPYDWGWSTPSDDALATLSVGNHVLKALATSTQGTTAEAIVNITIQSVNVAPTVNITAPVNGTAVTYGATITLTANAADTAPGIVTSVAFYDGAALLATDTTAPYSYAWLGATTGTHTITAKATDNNGAITTSAAISITVNPVNNLFTASYFHLVDKFTQGFMRPTAGSNTAYITQYQETTVPTLDSYDWEFIAAPVTGYYYIVNRYTGKAIKPTGNSIDENTNLSQTDLVVSPYNTELQWAIETSNEANYYWIKNRNSQKYIRPANGTEGTGIEIVQNTLNTTYSSFKWSLANPEAKAAGGKSSFIDKSGSVSETTATKTAIYPNPASEFVTVVTTVSETANVSIAIYNIAGNQILSQEFKSIQGNFEQSFNISAIPSGTYILKINKGDSKAESLKFIKR